jgi:tetratricopeptide (TPR) repeat protein/O-antigen ligase
MSVTTRLLDRLIELGLVGLLLLAPLPFGAVDPWASALVVAAIGALAAACALRMLAAREILIPKTPLLLPGLAGLILATIQLRTGGSLNHHATVQSFSLYAAYLALLVVLATHLVTRRRVIRLLALLVAWGTTLAAVGLVNHFYGRAVVPWFPRDFVPDRLISTFVNPNHQALYFEIIFFLALGLLLRPKAPDPRAGETRSAQPWGAGRGLAPLLLLGAMAVLTAAFTLTLSRGGIAATVAGLLVVSVMGLAARAGYRTVVPLLLVVVVAVTAASWVGADALLERVLKTGKDPLGDKRLAIWERSLHTLGEAPVLGTGLGTYGDAFPPHRPPGIPSDLVVDHAHNDYLELAVELGVVGLLVAGWALVALASVVLPRWAARHDPLVRGVVLGGIGGLTAIVVHSALDFGLHMPANALLAVFIGALLPNVVALRTRRGSGGGVDLPAWRWMLGPRARLVGGLAVAGGLVAVVFAQAPSALADIYVQRAASLAGGKARAKGAVSMRDFHGALQDLGEAVRLDPGNPSVHDAVAEVAGELALRIWKHGVAPDGRRLGPSSGERVNASQGYFAEAYAAHRQSLAINPRSAWAHDRFGRFLGGLEAMRQLIRGSSTLRVSLDPRLATLVDTEGSLIPEALAHLREGVRLDPLNVYRHRNLAAFALAHPTGPDSSRIVIEGFRTVLSLEAEFLDEVAERLESQGAAGRAMLRASMPRISSLWMSLARRWDKAGQREDALSAYEEALGLAADPRQQVEVRLAYSEFLVRMGKAKPGLEQARGALLVAPRDHRVFGALARAYEALQDWREAEGALTSAMAVARGTSREAVARYGDWLGQLLARRGQADQALVLYREIVAAVAEDPYVRTSLAKLLEGQGRWSEALPEYQAAEQLAPDHAGLRFDIGQAYVRHGLVQEGVTALEAVVANAPRWSAPRVHLAQMYAQLGSPDRAREQYRQVLALEPGNESARRALTALDGTLSPQR